MKAKTIVTIVLLLFVAVSVVYLVVNETGRKPVQNTTLPEATSPQEGQEPSATLSASSEDTTAFTGVVAYYFHGNVRCATCRKIEAYAKEAIETGFVDALKEGRLEWRVVNVEDPVNEHYIEDFQLSTRSVVLERTTGGKSLGWKNLQRVWELVHGDKENFLVYIQDETRDFFEAADK